MVSYHTSTHTLTVSPSTETVDYLSPEWTNNLYEEHRLRMITFFELAKDKFPDVYFKYMQRIIDAEKSYDRTLMFPENILLNDLLWSIKDRDIETYNKFQGDRINHNQIK